VLYTTIGRYYMNQEVTRDVPGDKVQPGSVTFCMLSSLEGVYLGRVDQECTPRFVTGKLPTMPTRHRGPETSHRSIGK
jgi:hypothetical protein